MVRKLRHHEKKLLKKFDFINWSADNNLHELRMVKRFHIQRREDYTLYNKLSRHIRGIADKLKDIDGKDPWREEMTNMLLNKLHNLGLIPTKSSLMLASKVNASSFCRRRLPVVMVRAHMAETLKAAVTFVEQGHVRVGPDTIRDPAFLVTRPMEDYVTWAPGSKIKKKVQEYNGMLDDFDE
ncbi:U3 small nucleolar ribonucleoprotein IMP3 [Taenia crassiceps]|uniref:U3 small nucleolar ribonucleoprotein IMP3 n=1 Tax=Taenia crassiceps TaxID=6207 RepID=A0ABR4QGW2_9CEST